MVQWTCADIKLVALMLSACSFVVLVRELLAFPSFDFCSDVWSREVILLIWANQTGDGARVTKKEQNSS
jgi:hypothetical protein